MFFFKSIPKLRPHNDSEILIKKLIKSYAIIKIILNNIKRRISEYHYEK